MTTIPLLCRRPHLPCTPQPGAGGGCLVVAFSLYPARGLGPGLHQPEMPHQPQMYPVVPLPSTSQNSTQVRPSLCGDRLNVSAARLKVVSDSREAATAAAPVVLFSQSAVCGMGEGTLHVPSLPVVTGS